MIPTSDLPRSQLKVLSSVFSNAILVWIAAIFGTTDLVLLTMDIILAILSWKIAVKIEEALEKYG